MNIIRKEKKRKETKDNVTHWQSRLSVYTKKRLSLWWIETWYRESWLYWKASFVSPRFFFSSFVSRGQGIQLKYHPATRTRFHCRLRSFGLRNLFGPGSSFREGKKRGEEERAFLRVPFQDGTSRRKKAAAEISTSRITLNYRSSYEAHAMFLGYCNFLFARFVS